MNLTDQLDALITRAETQFGVSRNRAAGLLLAQAFGMHVADLLEVAAFALVESCAPETAQDIAKLRVEWEQAMRDVAPPQKPS